MPSHERETTDLPRRLKIAREQAGLSQGQAARLLEMHRPTISNIESGQRRVTAAEVSRFAKLYGVSVEWLMNQANSVVDPAVELAARELAGLDPKDLNSLMKLIRTLKRDER